MVTPLISLPIESHQRTELINITDLLQAAVKKSGVREGLLAVQCLHTTAGLTINENADPDVVGDLLRHLEKMVPASAGFAHNEGNSDAHIKASLVGNSMTVLVSQGRLILGAWQGIYFCEFDGPRQRKVAARILGD